LSLKNEIFRNVVNVSLFSHVGNNVEVFLNIETKLFVVVSFSWVFLPVLLVDEIPLLVLLSCELVHEDILVFNIF